MPANHAHAVFTANVLGPQRVVFVLGQDADGAASVHLHAVLGLSDGSTRGGHFLDGVVHPTLEVMVTETPRHLCRRKRPELGIALLDLAAS